MCDCLKQKEGTMRTSCATKLFKRFAVVRHKLPRLLLPLLSMLLMLGFATVKAQRQTFTKGDLEYVVELPSAAWRVDQRVDVHDHVEFIYDGDASNGYLRLRKLLVTAETTPVDLFQRYEKWELQSLPGYVACRDCSGEAFKGYLTGAVFAYEFVSAGRPMAGRIYYLRTDQRTFYALHFTGARDKLAGLRVQMDSIAQSFRLK